MIFKHLNTKLLVLPLLFIGLNLSFGQDRKLAASLFEVGNFEEALEEYHLLLEEDAESIEYNYNIAICYLNTNIDKSKAISYLEFLTKNPKINPDAFYLLGRAYHFGYRFDDAIGMYQKFINLGKGSIENLENAQTQIAYCSNAKELMKFPVSVKFENLGENINSSYADYYPFIPVDEGFVLYNSTRENRNAKPLENGSYSPTIFISYVKDGKYSKGQKIPLNESLPDNKRIVVGLNKTGSRAVFYMEDYKLDGNLYLSGVKGNGIKEPIKMQSTINSKQYVEIAACITEDEEKIYFASNRPGGYGGVDLYLCQKLPNGDWSEAQNLGPAINSSSDEDFPNISPDGNTLYFSSKGHAGMGGYDIYKATWNPVKRKFSSIQNMGYPINTPEDNMNFRASETGKFGYISAVRKEGYGDLDIYRVDFKDVDSKYTVIVGTVSNELNKQFDDVSIQVTDFETDEVYGEYAPNPRTNRYVIILPPGKYNMFTEAKGYKGQFEVVEILDKKSFKSEINKDLEMVPEK